MLFRSPAVVILPDVLKLPPGVTLAELSTTVVVLTLTAIFYPLTLIYPLAGQQDS